MPGLGYALVVGLPGTFTAVVWSLLVGLAGKPGGLLSAALTSLGARPLAWLGVVVGLVAQLYVALIFTVLVLRSATHHLANVHGPGRWIAWPVAFLVASVPSVVGVLDWGRDPARAVQHRAVKITAPLATLGSIAFLIRPALMRLAWDWVPTI
jgi:hypothetical protein